jgi:hypothetical protein
VVKANLRSALDEIPGVGLPQESFVKIFLDRWMPSGKHVQRNRRVFQGISPTLAKKEILHLLIKTHILEGG